MKSLLAFLMSVSAITSAAQAVVANFSLTDVGTGSYVSLDQFAGKQGVVVLFTSNECPFDNYYSDRIASLVRIYSDRIPFLMVNSHTDPAEAEAKMKEKAAGWTHRSAYLADKSQQAMEACGARRSPEVFLLKPSPEGFRVYYSGAIDDNPQKPGAVSMQYLRDAMDNLLGGKPGPAPVRAAGCSIRRK